MEGDNDKCACVASGGNDCDSSLAEFVVNPRVRECCNGVACERAQEDERYNGVAKIVVSFELGEVGAYMSVEMDNLEFCLWR